MASVRYLDNLPAGADLAIVGGGIVGAATAFYAALAGLRPVLIERRAAVCTLTTPVATGAFRLQFDNRAELDLVRRSVALFEHFEQITAQSTYSPAIRRQGYLWLTTETETAARQQQLVADQHAWGLDDVELLDGAELRYRFPYLSEAVVQGRFRAGDGFLDQKALTMGLLAASGAGVVTACAVTGFQLTGSRLRALHTTQGTIETATAVIAAGPFSGQLAALAGVRTPITTVKRQKLILPEAPIVPPDAPMTIDEDTGTHWRPALHGAYVLCTDPTTPPSKPAEDVCPEHRFAFELLNPRSARAAARITPFWREVWARNDLPWLLQAGQYTMTPDHRPLIGPTPVEGLWLNSGYSGHGIMAGPAGSEHLVSLLVGSHALADNPFLLDRDFSPPAVASL